MLRRQRGRVPGVGPVVADPEPVRAAPTGPAASVLGLQRRAGNAAVCRMLATGTIRRTVYAPDPSGQPRPMALAEVVADPRYLALGPEDRATVEQAVTSPGASVMFDDVFRYLVPPGELGEGDEHEGDEYEGDVPEEAAAVAAVGATPAPAPAAAPAATPAAPAATPAAAAAPPGRRTVVGAVNVTSADERSFLQSAHARHGNLAAYDPDMTAVANTVVRAGMEATTTISKASITTFGHHEANIDVLVPHPGPWVHAMGGNDLATCLEHVLGADSSAVVLTDNEPDQGFAAGLVARIQELNAAGRNEPGYVEMEVVVNPLAAREGQVVDFGGAQLTIAHRGAYRLVQVSRRGGPPPDAGGGEAALD